MATDGDVDTSRARIQTYVPSYQKAEWQAHADELDMSLSEFVRSMVQAGRRGFSEAHRTESAPQSENPGEGEYSDDNPRGEHLEDRVLSILDDGGCYDWNELLDAVTDDVETRLEEALETLQDRGEIKHSGRKGGYVRR
jgi:hypothetical protein